MAETNADVIQEEKREHQKHGSKAHLLVQAPLRSLFGLKQIFRGNASSASDITEIMNS